MSALNQRIRHAQATKAWITLAQQNGMIVATVRDDGSGIGNKIAAPRQDSLGVGIGV